MALLLEGDKRAIILMHGYTGSTADVRMQGTFLNQHGYTVYMPEFRGHGTKDIRQVLSFSPQDWQEDAENAVQFLRQKGYTQIAVFGLSMGGMYAFYLLTKKYTEIIAGGSFNSPIPLTNPAHLTQAFLMVADKLYTSEFGEKLSYDALVREKLKPQIEMLQSFSETVAEQLARIETPIYIAQSGKDEMIDNQTGQRIANCLPFAEIEYAEFPDATHVITVGKYRQEFNQTLLDFINKLDWRTS